MGECKYCGKKGFFFSVDRDGLCKGCAPALKLQVQQSAKVIEESNNIINNSKKTATRISRCDTVLMHVEHLLKLENQGIPTLNINPSKLKGIFLEEKDNILFESTKEDVETLIAKAELAITIKSKLNSANNALLKVFEAKKGINKPSRLHDLEHRLRIYIHKTQLNAFLDEAHKAEFKGNKKKTLDQYQEARYFLKTDKIDDTLQKGEIEEIQSKINKLQQGNLTN